jgi:hypothetical protein
VTLKNSRAGDEAAAIEHVRLAIDVPDAAALDDVDHLFQEILAVDELDEHLLDLFADATTDLPRASRYASALHEYGVAILVKDHARGTADALPFELHRQKLQAALNVLRHFPERPVARAVCGFIRFGLNDLAEDRPPSGVPALDSCVRALQDLLGLEPTRVPQDADSPEGRCPTDHTTSFILERWDDPESFRDLGRARFKRSDDAGRCGQMPGAGSALRLRRAAERDRSRANPCQRPRLRDVGQQDRRESRHPWVKTSHI